MILCEAEVDGNCLAMTDVEEAIGLWGDWVGRIDQYGIDEIF